jgi:uncharacterized protein YfdQ (DUF2303 family)
MTEPHSLIPQALIGPPIPLTNEIDPGTETVKIVPPGWSLQRVQADESLRAQPQRPRGTITVWDEASFHDAVMHRRLAGDPIVYVDPAEKTLTAILNDDAGTDAGWRDYRVRLEMARTPEWSRWRAHDGRQMNQKAFAEFIEDSLGEIREPSAATMLELAQTFHAHVSAKFRGGNRLRDGSIQFMYDEDIDASAGVSGDLTVPSELFIEVAPFYGSEAGPMHAWFRFRLSRDDFTLGYKLDHAEDFERAAFDQVHAAVAARATDMLFVAGPTPENTEQRSVWGGRDRG